MVLKSVQLCVDCDQFGQIGILDFLKSFIHILGVLSRKWPRILQFWSVVETRIPWVPPEHFLYIGHGPEVDEPSQIMSCLWFRSSHHRLLWLLSGNFNTGLYVSINQGYIHTKWLMTRCHLFSWLVTLSWVLIKKKIEVIEQWWTFQLRQYWMEMLSAVMGIHAHDDV